MTSTTRTPAGIQNDSTAPVACGWSHGLVQYHVLLSSCTAYVFRCPRFCRTAAIYFVLVVYVVVCKCPQQCLQLCPPGLNGSSCCAGSVMAGQLVA
jgi:hypothetical protein